MPPASLARHSEDTLEFLSWEGYFKLFRHKQLAGGMYEYLLTIDEAGARVGRLGIPSDNLSANRRRLAPIKDSRYDTRK